MHFLWVLGYWVGFWIALGHSEFHLDLWGDWWHDKGSGTECVWGWWALPAQDETSLWRVVCGWAAGGRALSPRFATALLFKMINSDISNPYWSLFLCCATVHVNGVIPKPSSRWALSPAGAF